MTNKTVFSSKCWDCLCSVSAWKFFVNSSHLITKETICLLNVVNEDRRRFHWMNSESIFHESVNRFLHLPWISILISLDFISRYFFSYFFANLSKLTKFKYWIKSLFTLTMSTSFDSSLRITQYCSDSSISATELEPTTTYFIKEHSTI